MKSFSYWKISATLIALVLWSHLDAQANMRHGEINQLAFTEWAGPEIPVWIYAPRNVQLSDAPIVLVMHGVNRDAKRYLREWQSIADEHGIVVVAPELSAESFPKSDSYNLGNVFNRGSDAPNDEEDWSFSAIEPIFDFVVAQLDSRQTQYALYGHSAGSQFVHRFMYYKPDARVSVFLAANAGWYTLPDFNVAYPYGLKNAAVNPDNVTRAFSKNVVVLLGDKDTDANHGSLRKTPEAMEQGMHRYARGHNFFDNAQRNAEKQGVAFSWRLQSVPDIAHSNGGMARAAAAHVATVEAQYLQSVTDIQNMPKIKAAMRSVRDADEGNMERLITMTEIPAPPFAEETRANDFAARLKAAGLADVTIDSIGNVIGRRPGNNSQQTVAIVAHLDTVFPADMEIKVRREGNTLFAPGVADNTRALVALLTLVEVMQEHDIQTRDDLLFIGSVGEEGLGDLRGVRHLFSATGTAIDQFIAMDGGALNRIVIDGVGSNRYRVIYRGPGGHSYGAFGRANPHQALADTISQFTKTALKVTKKSGTKATFSVGRIGGGTSVNSIPFESWFEVDMRSADAEKVAELDRLLRRAIDSALAVENRRRTRGDALTVEVNSVGSRPAGLGDRNSTLAKNATDALRAVGVEAEFRASSTDANIPISLGVPAITISRGGISMNAHSPDESWQNVDSHLAIQAALLLLASQAQLAR